MACYLSLVFLLFVLCEFYLLPFILSCRMLTDFSWSCFFMKWSSSSCYQVSGHFLKCIQLYLLGSLQITWKWMSPLLGGHLFFSSSWSFVFDLNVCLLNLLYMMYWPCVMFYRTILLTYKHKTHSVDSDGKIISNADVDFYIDDVR